MSAPPTPPPHAPVSDSDWRFTTTGIPCEWAECYHPGGLHPVHLGDIFNQRYEVIRKLGNGSYATVWLALDSALDRYVSLKIEMAKLHDNKQLSIIRHLASKAPQDVDAQFVVTLLDSFVHDGPNGSHPCLVLEPMGPSVSTVLNAPQRIYDPRNPQPRRFSKGRTRAMLRNVLRGLNFLHRNGVVHGDIHAGNMLFALQDLASVGANNLRQDEGASRKEVLVRKDGKVDKWAPKYQIVSAPLDEYVRPEADQVVKIIDLGAAFMENEPPQSVVTPRSLRAPEIILGGSLTRSIDIWSFGCLVFALLTALPLIELAPWDNSRQCVDDEHLIQLTEVIQPLPEDLLAKWPRASRYFGPNGERLDARPEDFEENEDSHADDEDDQEYDDLAEFADSEDEYAMQEDGPPKPRDSIEKLFRDNKPEDVDEEEEKQILSLLRSILQYDPLMRPSAADLLEHPWVKG